MLKDTFGEQRSFAGYIVPMLLGVLGGGYAGYVYFQNQALAAGSPTMGMDYMGALAGACAGLFAGALAGVVLDRVMTHRQQREEEF